MGLFDDERLTVSVTQAQRRKLGELAKRAGSGVTMARVARAALNQGFGRGEQGHGTGAAGRRGGGPYRKCT